MNCSIAACACGCNTLEMLVNHYRGNVYGYLYCAYCEHQGATIYMTEETDEFYDAILRAWEIGVSNTH